MCRVDQVEALRDRALERYGKVHVLCNNAGVVAYLPLARGLGHPAVWETTANDWHWTLGVNLYGVIHGVRAFVPLMVEQGEEGHVVNTSSAHGLYTNHGSPTYAASKYAVTRITEGLFYDLAARNSRVKCSLLCPEDVATNIALAARNRPAEFQDQLPPGREAEIDRLIRHRYDRQQVEGISPAEVANLVVDGIREERFYLLTHADPTLSRVRLRMEAILAGRNPPQIG